MANLSGPWSVSRPVCPETGGGLFLNWRAHFDLGIKPMDEDHRAMATLIDHIGTEFALNSGPALPARHLQRRMAQLGELTRIHFAREELLMRESDYPAFLAHQREHAMLLPEYTILTREVAASGANRLDPGLLEGLKAWFLGHLLDDDRRLAEYLSRIGFVTPH